MAKVLYTDINGNPVYEGGVGPQDTATDTAGNVFDRATNKVIGHVNLQTTNPFGDEQPTVPNVITSTDAKLEKTDVAAELATIKAQQEALNKEALSRRKADIEATSAAAGKSIEEQSRLNLSS